MRFKNFPPKMCKEFNKETGSVLQEGEYDSALYFFEGVFRSFLLFFQNDRVIYFLSVSKLTYKFLVNKLSGHFFSLSLSQFFSLFIFISLSLSHYYHLSLSLFISVVSIDLFCSQIVSAQFSSKSFFFLFFISQWLLMAFITHYTLLCFTMVTSYYKCTLIFPTSLLEQAALLTI